MPHAQTQNGNQILRTEIEEGGLSEVGMTTDGELRCGTVNERSNRCVSQFNTGTCWKPEVRARATELPSRTVGVQHECEAGMVVLAQW